jgi:transcriptional regulator with XRE-family HTH domain
MARSSPELGAILTRLGQQTRALREARSFTQEQLADLAEIDPKHVQLVEQGRTNTTVATLAAIARALGVKISDLFEGV